MAEKVLLLDLDAAAKTEGQKIACAYYYHPNNAGVTDLKEIATFALLCRHCEDKPCLNACVRDALEKQEDGSVVRHNLRCVSCGSCVAACPFGVISPDIISYVSGTCDQCIGFGDEEPPCVASAPAGVLKWLDAGAPELEDEHIHMIGTRLAVRCRRWERVAAEPE
jgi:Fe-S-cluster-containing hydrogenase component 2